MIPVRNVDESEVLRLKEIKEVYIEKLASFFKSVSDETRVRIIYVLSEGEMCVSDISESLGISQSLVSHQLKLLKFEGHVKARRDGKKIYYSLDDEHVVEIFKMALTHIEHKMTEGLHE